ncbi:Hsp70 family protein [Sphingomonas sp. PAMC 26621]|uniref:Hsp70 family protein n=1 Tax=Sphingomonas sp. PAMC 26621 TaxID=1112213 RepID=UPI00030D45EC|nr:Hsp70 family protein [Sphingomonas sp. PAMC 26621]
MYLGIDLGTSNSAVVGNGPDGLRLFKTADGRDVLPSVIYADRRGARFVGTRAYQQLVKSPADVVHGFKRLMGTDSRLSFAASGISFTPEEASAEVLRALVRQVRSAVGEVDFEGAVVTIPAAFNQMRSEATIRAANLAGLERVGLIQEPVAAAMSALEGGTRRDGKFLVYDLGGGTFDAALVESLGGNVTVLAHEGINMLGGRDHDRVILDSIVRQWLASNFALPSNPFADLAYKRLFDIARAQAEIAKIELSTRDEATVFVSDDEARVNDLDGKPIYIEAVVTRAVFESLIAERIDESIALCRKLLSENHVTHDDLDRIVFIGGPSNIPFVREHVPAALGVPADLTSDPMTAVARGAAIFAESRNWGPKASKRKPQRAATMATGDIDVRFEYTARAADETGRIRVRVGPTAVAAGLRLRLTGPEGFDSGELMLVGDRDEVVRLPSIGENRFVAKLLLSDGTRALPDQALIITRVHASATAATAAQTVAIKVVAGPSTAQYNALSVLVLKGASLPAQGVKALKTMRELVGGVPGHWDAELFNQSEGVDDPMLNLSIGSFRVSSEKDLDDGQRMPAGTPVALHWQMDDNGLINCELEIASLGIRLADKKFYVSQVGHKNFDGGDGQSLAASSLDRAQEALDETEAALGLSAAPVIAELRRRLARHRELLANSADAEARRSITEEARHILQDIAKLRGLPDHRRPSLLADVMNIEDDFAEIAADASKPAVERMQTLGRTAREALSREDWDRTRQTVEEMRSLLQRAYAEDPSYWHAFLERFTEQRYAALDKDLHDRLVKAGAAAVEQEDLAAVRSTVQAMARNRVAAASDSREVALLAGLAAA